MQRSEFFPRQWGGGRVGGVLWGKARGTAGFPLEIPGLVHSRGQLSDVFQIL